MSYPYSTASWNNDENQEDAYSTYNSGQWAASTGYAAPNTSWNPGSAGDQSSYYPSTTAYPPTTYNPSNAGNPQGHSQYIDPRATLVHPFSASANTPPGYGYSGQPQYSSAPGAGNPYANASGAAYTPAYHPSQPAPHAPYSGSSRAHTPAPLQIQLTEGSPGSYSSGPAKICAHCSTSSTPVWRRDPRTHAPLCNACGVYLSTRGTPRPQTLIDVDNAAPSNLPSGGQEGLECSHCGTRTASAWRRNKAGEQVCNACGVYERMNGRPRPLGLRNDKIRPREKHRS